MATKALKTLYLRFRRLHALALGTGVGVALCLLWTAVCMASVRWNWRLDTTQTAWIVGTCLVVLAGLVGHIATKAAFLAWVRSNESCFGIEELWTCAIQTPPTNPFFPQLQEQALQQLHVHAAAFRRRVRNSIVLCTSLTLLLLVSISHVATWFSHAKVQMALGLSDSTITLQAVDEIANGEDWAITVLTQQPGPYRLEIKSDPPVVLPFQVNALTLTAWKESIQYRVHTSWDNTAWSRLDTYEPITWDKLLAHVTYPTYLETPPTTFDLRQGRIEVVEGATVQLTTSPQAEWTREQAPRWVTKVSDDMTLRPVKGKRHGLWSKLPITVVRDLSPKVAWERPLRDIVWGKQETALAWSASDDFGLRKAQVQLRKLGVSDGLTIPIWSGKTREQRWGYTLGTKDLPWKPGDVYEVLVSAQDSAGQWGTSEPRFLEMKDDKEIDGMDGKKPDTISLRATIVALLDMLRDWDKAQRAETLKRIQTELRAFAVTAKSIALQQMLHSWANLLAPTADKLTIEQVVREMVIIQQQAEQTKPKPQPEGQSSEQSQDSKVFPKDIAQLQAMQQAAMDPNLGASVRNDLQKQISDNFAELKPRLEAQLPQSENMLNNIAQTQKSLELNWDSNKASLHLQQLGNLKAALGKEGSSQADSSVGKETLMAGLKDAVQQERGVSPELLQGMEKAASTDTKTDWDKLQAAAQKWNRALQSGLPQLKSKAKSQLQSAIQEAEAATGEKGSPESAESSIAEEITKALTEEKWTQAKNLAAKAGWSSALQRQIEQAEAAPIGERKRLVRGIYEEAKQQTSMSGQKARRNELNKAMSIDPKWEPQVDQYFELLNKRP